MMEFLMVLCFSGALFVVIFPFFFNSGYSMFEDSQKNMALLVDLMQRKDQIMRSWQDLHADMKQNKLSADDYERLKLEIQTELAQIEVRFSEINRETPVVENLQAGDSILSTASISDPESVSQPTDTSGKENARPAAFCHQCGTTIQNNFKFCPACGTKVVNV